MDTNTIAITGANGQLGTSLLRRLAEHSHKSVVALVRSDRAQKKGYRTYKLRSGTTSERGRYVKSLGEPRDGAKRMREYFAADQQP